MHLFSQTCIECLHMFQLLQHSRHKAYYGIIPALKSWSLLGDSDTCMWPLLKWDVKGPMAGCCQDVSRGGDLPGYRCKHGSLQVEKRQKACLTSENVFIDMEGSLREHALGMASSLMW